MRDADNNSWSSFLSVGAYCMLLEYQVWTISIVANFSELVWGTKSTPTSTTPLIRANMSCAVATIFYSFAFLSLSVSMAKLSCLVATIFSRLAFLSSSISVANMSSLVAAPFSSLALLSSSVFTANLSCLLATTFSSLSLLTNSFSCLFLSLSFLCSSVSEAPFASFRSDVASSSKAALAYSRNE